MTAPRFQHYAELCVTSNFTFLTGASHPEELVTRAAELGLAAIAITDRNSVAGVVRAYSALKELARLQDEAQATNEAAQDGPTIRSQRVTDHSSRQTVPHFTGQTDAPAMSDAPLPKLIAGARLVLTDSLVEWLALPTDLAAWSRLTRLLSLGKRRAPKGECHLQRADLAEWGKGMVLIALPPDPQEDAQPKTARSDLLAIARAFPGQCFLGAAPRYDGRDQARLDQLAVLAQGVNLPMVAVGDVLMHRAARRPLADVLTCLRAQCTIDNIGEHRLANGERRLKSGAEMARLFHRHPAALRRTVEIADRCAFRLNDLRYQYPDEAQDGEPAQDRLQITARKVWLMRLGDTTRLKAIAASVRRHLNLLPVEQPESAPEPAPEKKLLVLFESSADAAAAGRLNVGNPPMAVIAWPALVALTKPQGIEKIASALRNRQIAGCLLIAASGEGPAPAVAAEWCTLENAVQRNGVLDIVTLRQDGQMQIVKTNATRVAQLDQDSTTEGPALRQTDDQEPDPDPW